MDLTTCAHHHVVFWLSLILLVSNSPSLVADIQNSGDGEETNDIRLQDGQTSGTGTVMVRHGGKWGAVCDDGWNLLAAHVVCRYLGHPHALGYTTQAYFGVPKQDIILDDVRCHGDEDSLDLCQHDIWLKHDCDPREAAGVYCAPSHLVVESQTPERSTPIVQPTPSPEQQAETITEVERLQTALAAERLRQQSQFTEHKQHTVEPYEIRMVNGRSSTEGRVEVNIGGRWGAICSDTWTLLDAVVACRQAGLGYGQMAVPTSSFGGESLDKVFGGIMCDGDEGRLSDCYHGNVGVDNVKCPQANYVAGVVCTPNLPDLVPNATLLETSAYLEDRPMLYMQCAMEEKCASSSAYELKKTFADWHAQRRRLLRFSSSIWNFGTADFRPDTAKFNWEWHDCHMHYHSMSVFSHYDLLDHHGNKIAEGHKASFCLEDVECMAGKEKKYACVGYGDQGISTGCADNYLHDIDCQWIDITDVKPGSYIFQVHVNPELRVAEMNYDNNAATCNLEYSGFQVYVTDCTLGSGHTSLRMGLLSRSEPPAQG